MLWLGSFKGYAINDFSHEMNENCGFIVMACWLWAIQNSNIKNVGSSCHDISLQKNST